MSLLNSHSGSHFTRPLYDVWLVYPLSLIGQRHPKTLTHHQPVCHPSCPSSACWQAYGHWKSIPRNGFPENTLLLGAVRKAGSGYFARQSFMTYPRLRAFGLITASKFYDAIVMIWPPHHRRRIHDPSAATTTKVATRNRNYYVTTLRARLCCEMDGFFDRLWLVGCQLVVVVVGVS